MIGLAYLAAYLGTAPNPAPHPPAPLYDSYPADAALDPVFGLPLVDEGPTNWRTVPLPGTGLGRTWGSGDPQNMPSASLCATESDSEPVSRVPGGPDSATARTEPRPEVA